MGVSILQKIPVLVSVFLCAFPAQAKPTAYEREVLKALNRIRARPTSLIPRLEKLLKKFDGKYLYVSPTVRIETKEGAAPVSEAIRALRKTKPAPTMEYSPTLARAARDHARNQGKSGEIGHFTGSEGPADRAQKYTRLLGKSGENITYGNYGGDDGEAVILALIVDDGVPDRGHRRNVFDPKFARVGIACGKHAKYLTTCVFDMTEKELPK